MNPAEVPAEFLSVAEQLSGAEVSQRESSFTLIKHSFQAVLGTKYPLQTISSALQVPVLMGSERLELIQSERVHQIMTKCVKCGRITLWESGSV